MLTAEGTRWAATKKTAVPILELLLEMVTERRLSGRCEGVLGGESRLKALAIMRVAAEMKRTIQYPVTFLLNRVDVKVHSLQIYKQKVQQKKKKKSALIIL